MMIDRLNISVAVCVGSDLTALAVQTALHRGGIDRIELVSVVCSTMSKATVWIWDDYTNRIAPTEDGRRLRRILLSNHCEPYYVYRVIEGGFFGYLYLGDSLVERLPQAVKDVAAGGRYLSPTAAAALAQIDYYARHIQPRITPYQVEVLRLMSQHWSGGRIAAELGRSTTAIYQVQRYLRDLFEVETNGELLDCAVQLGILPDTRRISA